MSSKEWFLLFRYPVPDEMEYFLEEKATEGYFLKNLGQTSLFYYEFEEDKSQKCKYMVDKSAMSKVDYMETMINNGWEYLGSSFNCYIWRQKYSDNRPKDLSDAYCKGVHCRNTGIGFFIACIIFIAAAIAFTAIYFYEKKVGAEVIHTVYLFQSAIQIPFIIFTGHMAGKFIKGSKRYL